MSHSSDKQHNRCQHQRHHSLESTRQRTNDEQTQKQISCQNNTKSNGRSIEEVAKDMMSHDIYNNISSTLAQLQKLEVDEKLTFGIVRLEDQDRSCHQITLIKDYFESCG